MHCRSIWILGTTVLTCLAGQASSAPFIPSTRWILLGSPLFPTSHEECRALSQQFSEIIQQLSADHDACLQDAPKDDHASGGCSKASCQALHTARDEAQKKSLREAQTCSARVSAYLDEKRREAAEAERQRSTAQREAREEDTRRARRDQERAQDEARRKADEERRERERVSERDQRERDARNDEERRARDLADARKRDELEARLAVLREKQTAEQHQRSKVDRATYDRLAKELTTLKNAGNKISTAIEFAKNPFAAAAEKASNSLSSAVTGAAIDAMLPGKEGSNSRYDAVAEVVDAARTRALSGNPFAEKISGAAMEGVRKIHGKLLGELDQAGADIKNFGREDASASRSKAPVVRAVPTSPSGGGAAAPSISYSGRNLFAENPARGNYYDPDTRVTLEIPSGHVLYREPESRRLIVMNSEEVGTSAPVGDNPKLGEKGCSTTGVGIVTPVCEKKRRAKKNPFGGQ